MQNPKSLSFLRNFLFGAAALFVSSVAMANQPAVPAGSMSAPPTQSGQAAQAAAPQQAPGMGGMLFYLALMFALIYFFMIRPQRKRMKDHQSMLGELKHGDDVVTQAGILGKVTGITEKVVTLEVDDNVRLKVLKSQVGQIIKGQIKDLAPQ